MSTWAGIGLPRTLGKPAGGETKIHRSPLGKAELTATRSEMF